MHRIKLPTFFLLLLELARAQPLAQAGTTCTAAETETGRWEQWSLGGMGPRLACPGAQVNYTQLVRWLATLDDRDAHQDNMGL